ncbi:hypothetical protein YYC_02081 [Plasmodium yoelii 17X]|uniref:Uncharacterized protein n=2 Tax=Plasmodium yoelii TaxID=5861 RepID=Q7RJA0_PLAYO|nr:hypothetical protein [Plasmodium yoelii yoelii]ETB61155.1 hypothetical protein YYC_02081 [Plasmodium yoelii 17X]
MDDKGMCELFLEADGFFSGNDVHTKVSKSLTYRDYCTNKKTCSNTIESIGALGEGLSMKVYTKENKYFDNVLLWLAHKLFNMINETDKDKANKITLSSAYDEYLKKYMGSFKYWNNSYNTNGLKNANLRHMHEIYMLLKEICNTIVDHKKNGAESGSLSQNSVKCLNQYISLYNKFSECDSYRYLLAKLKKIYEDFRTSAIAKDGGTNKLNELLKQLTTADGKDSYSIEKFKTFNFNGPECKPKNVDNIQSVQDQPGKDITTTQNSKNQGGDQSSQDNTHKTKDGNLKGSGPESKQQKGIQLPKAEDHSLKGDPAALKHVSNDTDTQKGKNGQTHPSRESETNQGKMDISQIPKDNHDVFDLSTLKEYGDLVKKHIEEYKEYVTSSLNDIQEHLYEDIWLPLYETYNTYADYYENFDIMEYLKVVQANEAQKTQTLENTPPSNGLEPGSPLPDRKTPDVEKSEPKDTQTQILDGQGNDHSKESSSIQKLGSTNSEQDKISDIPSEERSHSPDGSTNIIPSLGIEARAIKADVQNEISEIGFLGNLFKEYKLVAYPVMIIAILVILAFMYKVIERKLKKIYYYIFCGCIKIK